MPQTTWRPASEAEAVSTPAVFLEWLRAVRGVALDGVAALAAWRREAPAAFDAAMSDFVGLPCDAGVCAALLRGLGPRTALVLFEAGGDSQNLTRAELLASDTLPEPVEKMLAALTPADLPALAASHLLDADTRPDTRLLWAGDPADPWPLGAWLVGAALLLAVSGDPQDVADAVDATVVRAAPRWRG
jgi:hypothetical protein